MISNLFREAWILIAGLLFYWRRGARFILVIGGPGAGKGTQSLLLAKLLGLPHLSTGDLIRRHLAAKTELGKEIEKHIQRINGGGLVPDDLIMRVLIEELKDRKYWRGAILDGFPRTLFQAKALDKALARWGNRVEKVILLDVPEPDLIDRLSLRRTCSNKSCGRTYHLRFAPPIKADTCDACGSPLYQRSDDTPEAIRERLKTYKGESKPLCDYYLAGGRLTTITATNGMTIEQVTAAVSTALRG
jgi:adenylate kinase